MIQQLILNSLLACQPKATPEIATPPKDPDVRETTDYPPEELEKKTPANSPITLVDELSAPKPPQYPNALTSSVQLYHLPHPSQKLSDEKFCEAVCLVLFDGGYQVVSRIDACQLELLSNWKEEQDKMLGMGDDTTIKTKTIGNIECTAEIHQYMRGRAGLSPSKGSAPKDDLGGYFAQAAQEEITAVFAFQEIKENLRSFGAPQQLLDDCEKAIIDEQRHTMMMTALAKRHGCGSIGIQLPKQKKVSIFELAKHNAIAGCIEETWSALITEYQAQNTKHYAKLFTIIAKDEIFHAQLSWDIHQWLMTKLSEKEQQEIKTLMQNKLEQSPPSESTQLEFGEMNSAARQQAWSSFKKQIHALAA